MEKQAMKLGIRSEEVGIMRSKKAEGKSTSLFLIPNSYLLIFNSYLLILHNWIKTPVFGQKSPNLGV
jgi:hypothetical protein